MHRQGSATAPQDASAGQWTGRSRHGAVGHSALLQVEMCPRQHGVLCLPLPNASHMLAPPRPLLPPMQLCKECFYQCLEDEVHHTIITNDLFKPGERVAIAASGGKDSTVLAHLMTLLNERHK